MDVQYFISSRFGLRECLLKVGFISSFRSLFQVVCRYTKVNNSKLWVLLSLVDVLLSFALVIIIDITSGELKKCRFNSRESFQNSLE